MLVDVDKSALPVFNLWILEEKELVGGADREQTNENIVENYGDIYRHCQQLSGPSQLG